MTIFMDFRMAFNNTQLQYKFIDKVLYVEGVKFHRGRFKGTLHFRNNLGLKDSLDPSE